MEDKAKNISAEKPKEVSFQIPAELAKEFAEDLRVVIRDPGIMGIIVPDKFLHDKLKGLEVVITPNKFNR